MHTIKPNDYGYASHECYESEVFYRESGNDYRQEACTSTNWLYNAVSQWTLSPDSNGFCNIHYIYSIGPIANRCSGNRLGARPTLYLSSSVKITSGTGTSSDPYELSM